MSFDREESELAVDNKAALIVAQPLVILTIKCPFLNATMQIESLLMF